MKTIRAVVIAIGLVTAALPPFDSPRSVLLAQGRPADVADGKLSQLRGMAELKSWFNGYKGRPRLILLLSPT